MATPNVVPRADQEGGLGTAAKAWGKLFIENPTAGGTAAATITNLDVDQYGLQLTGSNTTANLAYFNANQMTTGNTLQIDNTSSTHQGSQLELRTVTANTTNLTNDGALHINYTKTGNLAGGNTHAAYGVKNIMTDTGTNSGSISFYGYMTNLTGLTGGSANNYGHLMTVTGADGNYGHIITCDNGTGPELTLRSSANNGDICEIATTTNGATTITTTDADASLAHFEIAADGNITLDPAGTIALEAATVVTGAITGNNYRSIYIDASAMVPAATNGADAGTEEMHATNFTTLDYFAFDKATEEYADFKLVMPEQYNGGNIKAKFYWKAADAETGVSVVWGIKAYAATDDDTLLAPGGTIWGTEQVIEDTNDSGNLVLDDLNVSPATPDLTIAGTANADKLIFFRVFRKVAAAADDYDNDAELLGVRLQYQESGTAYSAW